MKLTYYLFCLHSTKLISSLVESLKAGFVDPTAGTKIGWGSAETERQAYSSLTSLLLGMTLSNI